MSATLKALGWDLDADPTNASGPNPDWLTEESRDELEVCSWRIVTVEFTYLSKFNVSWVCDCIFDVWL